MTDDLREVERHAAQLMEHFESVQIICTKQIGANTQNFSTGLGSGRVASCEEYLVRSKSSMVPEHDRD